MCGRYSASRTAADLVQAFQVDDIHGAEDLDGGELAASWNVAPTDRVYAVLDRPPRGEPDAPARRQLRVARWGLVPPWAKDTSIGSRLINARLETAAEKPAFRKAFAARRCVLPADGYYEWYTPTAAKATPSAVDGAAIQGAGRSRAPARRGSGKPAKQPFFLRPKDGGILPMAGLYELWRDESRDREDPAAWLWTVTVITTEAVDELGRIHDRMPMILIPEHVDSWLDPRQSDPDRLRDLLVPAAPGLLEAYPVSPEVGSVRNNGPHLVEPLRAEGDPAPAGSPSADPVEPRLF